MKAILSEKGQVTIPREIRDRLGLTTGQVIDFGAHRGLLIGKKKSMGDSLDDVIGVLRGKVGDVDSYLDEIRGPRPKYIRRK